MCLPLIVKMCSMRIYTVYSTVASLSRKHYGDGAALDDIVNSRFRVC